MELLASPPRSALTETVPDTENQRAGAPFHSRFIRAPPSAKGALVRRAQVTTISTVKRSTLIGAIARSRAHNLVSIG
jgi:hypothetical protein